MAVQFYFENLDPTSFQRLVNALLTARFGEAVRLMPLRGKDGGRDAEILNNGFLFEINTDRSHLIAGDVKLKAGRYFFQVKYHRTTDIPGNTVRSNVVSDFKQELVSNVLNCEIPVNYFFLITNVPGSKESISKVDEKRKQLVGMRTDVHVDVLWQEHVVSWLDQSPRVWHSFPELFPGGVIPILGQIAEPSQALPRSIKMAMEAQSRRDGTIRFRQINLEQRLSKLFVDLDVSAPTISRTIFHSIFQSRQDSPEYRHYYFPRQGVSCIGLLVSELVGVPQRIILEGGPGQGKSTMSQMLAQLYRSKLLNTEQEYRDIWSETQKARFPFRMELRAFAEWLEGKNGSIEQFLAATFSRDAGGTEITVEHIHTIVENQPVILVFDGLDEVGSDDLRDVVISKLSECITRFEEDLKADLKVILTTRPPAIAGRISKLTGFTEAQILPLSERKVQSFIERWTEVQCDAEYEREQVLNSFNKRSFEQHVSALAQNPMQLSVLLHFIRLKGEAFPDRRAELYREYFKTVIDRDVEKSPRLRQHRDEIEALHEVIGFEIHSRAESDASGASLSHQNLIEIVQTWLRRQQRKPELANDLFRLGEERLGLIVVLKGEGADARYGFDVQPIREYFAAAYINDKCEGNAHHLFELMVLRSFWHEVALFLAGLRRANEKADLLSRSKSLDVKANDGWRSSGQAIILQLLQEGVFTTPGHVQRDALVFLVESLDPGEMKAKRESKGLLLSLSKLISSCESSVPSALIRKLLDKALSGEDRHAIWRLFQVAYKVLSSSELEKYIGNYSARKRSFAPLIKLLWPASEGLNYADALQSEITFVAGPDRDWAHCLFQSALMQPALTDLPEIPKYHEYLVEQFAFQPLFKQSIQREWSPFRPIKPFAVWRLCENLQLLAHWLTSGEKMAASSEDANFSGLSEATRSTVEALISSSSLAIKSLNRGEPLATSLRKFLILLHDMLEVDGITSWIAARCAVSLMPQPLAIQLDEPEYYYYQSSSKLVHLDEWQTLRRYLTPFFRAAIPHDLDRGGKTFAARIVQQGLHQTCPSHVRIDGHLNSMPEIIANRWFKHGSTDADWIDRAPFPKYWIPELFRIDTSMTSLSLLANRNLGWFGPWTALSISETKNLFYVVDSSKDTSFVAGALFALLGSKLWNIAKVQTIGKMLEADTKLLDIGYKLFRSNMVHPSIRIRQLAKAIVENKFNVSLATSTSAAEFLGRNTALNLPPLRATDAFDDSAIPSFLSIT